mgnify:FL=1
MTKFKGHYNQHFKCLSCNKRTDIMLDNCTHCGSRTPVDQKDYRRMRTRKLNEILISKFKKNLKELNDLNKEYPNIKIDIPKRTLWDNLKFNIGFYKGLIKHKLDLY